VGRLLLTGSEKVNINHLPYNIHDREIILGLRNILKTISIHHVRSAILNFSVLTSVISDPFTHKNGEIRYKILSFLKNYFRFKNCRIKKNLFTALISLISGGVANVKVTLNFF